MKPQISVMTLILPIWMIQPFCSGNIRMMPNRSRSAVSKLAMVSEYIYRQGHQPEPTKIERVGFKPYSLDYDTICNCKVGGRFAIFTFEAL